MPRFRDSRVIAKPRAILFQVVSEVQHYPDFLPWCMGARVYGAHEGGFDADLIVGYKMFREMFSSRVTFDAPRLVRADYKRGPLRRLSCTWRFDDIPQGTIVDFDVDFEFTNPTFDQFLSARFDGAVEKMATAFDARAGDILSTANP